MPDFHDVFAYFEEKRRELQYEYGLNTMEYSACGIRDTDSIRRLITRLANELFDKEEVRFLDAKNQLPENKQRVYFAFCGQELFLEIDPRHGHIELDFHETIQFMSDLVDMPVLSINPTGVSVSGDYEDLKSAWEKGFPIHLPEIDFRHKNINGRFFKREEFRSFFVIKTKITSEEFAKGYIISINQYLKQKGKDLEYNHNQVRPHSYNSNHAAIEVSGDTGGEIKVEGDLSLFRNSFTSQVFLQNYYLPRNPDLAIWYRNQDGEEIDISEPFSAFIGRFGKTPTS